VRLTALAGALGVCALLALAAAPTSRALDPPNPNDPCSRAGRDTCGTTGVGFYRAYRYGIRWFGDFRGAIPEAAHTFCLDLGYWYPAGRHDYREQPADVLRNRLGRTVPLAARQKLAYAVWTYGRTTSATRQAAVMLYVHSLMGDARRGEADPAAIGPRVASVFRRVAADAARFHGPYRVVASLPTPLAAGETATAAIRVLSAAGHALPGVELALAGRGTTELPGSARTDASGTARVTFTAGTEATVRLTVTAGPLASSLPRVFAATTPASAPNGQRLAVPASQRITETVSASVARTQLDASTTATPASLAVGEEVRDRVTIGGALASWRATVAARIYGPFRSAGEVRCDGIPAWTGSFPAQGSGTFTTPPATLARPGLYTFQETIPGDAVHVGLTTPCGVASERFVVQAAPGLRTAVSSQRVTPGKPIADLVEVSGLSGEHVTVEAALYGPFPSREAIGCTGRPAWTGTLDAAADGQLETEPFTPTEPGYYTYRERIGGGDFVRGVETPCGEEAETTVVTGVPKLVTQVSAQRTRPGGEITDRIVLSGLGALSVTVEAELWGPFQARESIRCSGTPYWAGTLVASGDGTYTTAPVRLDRAGWYAYRESIPAGPANDALVAPCAEAAETTVVEASPTVTTLVSNVLVRPGASVFDRVGVRGLGALAAGLVVELHGPFPTRAAISCSGRPLAQVRMTVRGDGVVRSPATRVARAGFYTFRERLLGSDIVPARTTGCGLAAETALAAPQIVTGRGDARAAVPAPRAGPATPVRVQIASREIDAPVLPVGIDVAHGVLAAPAGIHRLGWWRDGATPGSASGSTLVVGHVDSRTGGPGAFFRLKDARPGDRVEVMLAAGRTLRYRVVSVRTYPKTGLPTGVWSTRGKPRLVLVTCGGPFDPAARHYRDNVVVTAVPV
jgi:hypothetical protein